MMKYCADLPYPEPQVEKENIEYAKILLFSYAGNVSEETAVNQYMYQHFVLDGEVSNALRNIGIVEMHHLELLAETIKLLGMDPKYQIYNLDEIIPWTADFVPYGNNLKEMLDIDIEGETMAIVNYRKSIELIDDKYIRALLERIILDEEVHLKIFHELKQKYT